MMDQSLIIDSNEEIEEKMPNYEKKETKESSGTSGSGKKEAGGMNLTLDETLENSNLHFTRIAREKIAAKEAAKKAMEARKNAMVEASWCRVLNAARIKNKEAETELEKAKKLASEAFESARKMGVMMYDRPDSQNRYDIQTLNPKSGLNPNKSGLNPKTGTGTTHRITASFETPFEIDKQVSHAVKLAFFKLANKEEFEGLLWKIRENPQKDCFVEGLSETGQTGQMDLVCTMLERLKGLKEKELVSLAEIVATCGLSEALLEVESKRLSVDEKYELGLGFQKEDQGSETLTLNRRREKEVPSLDKFLVKKVSKLEREVQEAKLGLGFQKEEGSAETLTLVGKKKEKEVVSEVPSLDKFLVKRVSKLEREVQEARNNKYGTENRYGNKKTDLENTVPPLESVLVKKHMSRLEREVYEAKQNNNKNNNNNIFAEKNLNIIAPLPPIGTGTRLTRLQKARLETLKGFNETGQTGLDKILVKPVCRLEREKNESSQHFEIKKSGTKEMSGTVESLSDVLKSQRPKSNEFVLKSNFDGFEARNNEIISERKKERERELMEVWGNLSLENSIKPRLSRIERDKIAWKKAEEEQKNQVGAQNM